MFKRFTDFFKQKNVNKKEVIKRIKPTNNNNLLKVN